MLIKQYIKELLYIHECVTIPSFGAFLTQSTRAFVNYEVGNFEPPKKIIGFKDKFTPINRGIKKYISEYLSINPINY